MLLVSYVKDKVYKTDIFEYYRIKYKLGGACNAEGQRLYHSIYAINEKRSCGIPIDIDQDLLEIFIFGKLFEDEDEDFKIISTIPLPFEEIITAISLKGLN
jgi:hypothetical protein